MIVVIRKIDGYAEMGYSYTAQVKVIKHEDELEDIKKNIKYKDEFINVYNDNGDALYCLIKKENGWEKRKEVLE